MFFDQFTKLCAERNTTPTKFITDILHLSSSKVTAWKNGSIPKYEILNLIADYFNVSVGTLFDGKENKTVIQSQKDVQKINGREKELLKYFRELSDEEQIRLIARAEVLAEQAKFEESVG